MGVELYVWWVLVCGLGANLWLAVKLAGIVARVLYAAAAAISFTRFCWACGKVHGFRRRKLPHWMYAPSVWFGFFSVELWSSADSVAHMGGRGSWRGIGDWHVFPKSEDEQ
ncbi:MAG: hypothetical protein CMK71_02635 [Pseudomonadaceae bacterium]|nr:hypothetical protein [Pseudomonadaceae bacterium]|tara:strand:+ start:192 stop:524 length:333 start_codon:yes stop_codon:yes gene_type:complete